MDKLISTCTTALNHSGRLTAEQQLECYWKRGLAFWYREGYRDAARDFAAAKALRPADTEARMMLARCYRAAGDPDRAWDELRALAQDKPDLSTPFAMMALIKLAANDVDAAVPLAAKAVGIDDNDPWGHFAKARLGYDRSNRKEFRQSLSKCLEVSLTRPTKPYLDLAEAAFYLRANDHFTDGNYDDCISDCNRILRDKALVIAAITVKTHVYIELGNLPAARAEFAKLEQSNGTQPLSSDLRMLGCLLNGNREAAAQIAGGLTQQTKLGSDETLLAAASLAMGDRAVEAASVLGAPIRQREPMPADVMGTAALVLSSCLRDEKYYKKSVNLAEEANRITDGNNPRILIVLSIALASVAQHDEAVKTAERALARLPANAPIRVEYERILKSHKEKKKYQLDIKSEWALGLML